MKGQYQMKDYEINEVRVRLCEGGSLYSTSPIASPYDAVDLMAKELSTLDREELVVLNLNNQNMVINYHVVSMGSINQTIASPAEILKSGILSNAASFVMMHNHPSGKPQPSKEDINVTDKILLLGKLMEMPLLDHIIIGGMTGNMYSFRENFEEKFKDLSIDTKSLEETLKRKGRKR